MPGMIDVSRKSISLRIAVAEGVIRLRRETVERIKKQLVEKGDVTTAVSIAASVGVKNTPLLVPFTHNIPIEHVGVDIDYPDDEHVRVVVTVKATAKTGVEMDALAGVTAALLTIWDMVKKYEKDEKGQYPYTRIEYVRVLEKIKENV